MKFHAPLVAFSLVASLSAAEVPKVFAGLFEQDVPVKGQIGVMMPPPERTFRTLQMSWYPGQFGEVWGEDGPWLRMFRNARKSLG